MKETLHYGFILAVICAVAGCLLAGINSITKPKIIAQAQAEEDSALRGVMLQATHFDPIKNGQDTVYYKVLDKSGKYIGVAFKTSAKGYSDIVNTLVGMDRNGSIVAIKILSQNETPGLGTRILEPPFTAQFSGKDPRDFSRVQAITGATISSSAVINSVQEKAKEIQELIKNEPR